MGNLNQYIKRRVGKARSGERLYIQVPVPKDLRGRFGHAVTRCLRTDSLKVARIRRDEMLPDIRANADPRRPHLGPATLRPSVSDRIALTGLGCAPARSGPRGARGGP